MVRMLTPVALLLASCSMQSEPAANASDANSAGAATSADAPLSLTRLDCGTITIKNFDEFFSDRPGLYEAGPRDVAASCYLIRHGEDLMLWDTGLAADLKGQSFDAGPIVMKLSTTIAEQLQQLGITPEDIDVVGISHSHGDHTGQAALFPDARLVIGAGDFTLAQEPSQPGGPNPIAPWVKEGASVTKVSSDTDIFGDGSVVAQHLPGHTPDHMALLVNLATGPVLLTGDLYHSTEARQKRGVPPFNTSREKTLQSMDAFEAKAKQLGAKVIIQHEPGDIAKLPAFPEAAK